MEKGDTTTENENSYRENEYAMMKKHELVGGSCDDETPRQKEEVQE